MFTGTSWAVAASAEAVAKRTLLHLLEHKSAGPLLIVVTALTELLRPPSPFR